MLLCGLILNKIVCRSGCLKVRVRRTNEGRIEGVIHSLASEHWGRRPVRVCLYLNLPLLLIPSSYLTFIEVACEYN